MAVRVTLLKLIISIFQVDCHQTLNNSGQNSSAKLCEIVSFSYSLNSTQDHAHIVNYQETTNKSIKVRYSHKNIPTQRLTLLVDKHERQGENNRHYQQQSSNTYTLLRERYARPSSLSKILANKANIDDNLNHGKNYHLMVKEDYR